MAKKNLDISNNVTHQATNDPYVVKTKKELGRAKLDEMMKEETKTVKGMFQCFETPGATVKIVVKKYPGIPQFEKTMTDGEIYEIPLYVARHLNGIDATAGAVGDPELRRPNIGTCSYPVHGFMMKNNELNPSVLGEGGAPVPIIGISKRVKRYGFQSMEFASGF